MKKPTLVIVESPAKAKTIAKYLGPEYRVLSSIGHVRDLPKNNRDAVDIEGGFIPRYVISPGKEKIIAGLRRAVADAGRVLLASDPDREGEAIAWHVSELIKDKNDKPERVVFHEITEEAIKEALKHPRGVDLNLKEAQEARRVLDRLVGYDLSGLIWKKVRYGLSAGRVQSPALRILMEREREIRAFAPETYFTLTALVMSARGEQLTLTSSVTPKERAEAQRLKLHGESRPWEVREVKESEVKRAPRPPFTTSTLQQAASTRLGFSPSRTMGAAQKLYEAGFITYMRTDSTALGKGAQAQILAHIKEKFGDRYAHARQYKTKSKSAQEAHEAVRTTAIARISAGATADQKALYSLIRERTLASQMTDAVMGRTKITAGIAGEPSFPDFAVSGARIIFDGWLLGDPRARGEETLLPKLNQGEALTLKEIVVAEKKTEPPGRYTEAGLIKELEKRGIGRPSTYASIIKTIVDRGYVTKEGRTLVPTMIGDVVSSFLERYFSEYISDGFTSQMEDKLDEIAAGKRAYGRTLGDFYKPFHAAVVAKDGVEKLTNLGPGPAQFPCPKCGGATMIKLGKSGTFLSCARFPECDGARLENGAEMKMDTPLGAHPQTGEPVFVLRSRFGPFVQLGATPKKIKGKKGKKAPVPKRASLPPGKTPESVTLDEAVKYLELPRILGAHPKTGEPIVANTGRYGPYVGHAGDFRSLKSPDDPYTITLERALVLLGEPKKMRRGEKLLKELGLHPKTRRVVNVYESKSGRYLKKGLHRVGIPDHISTDDITLEAAIELLKQ